MKFVKICLVSQILFSFLIVVLFIADFKNMRNLMKDVSSVKVDIAEKLQGLNRASESETELDFLRKFRKKLVNEDQFDAADNKKNFIRDELLSGFKDSPLSLSTQYALTERESLVAYTMLRVHGSMPTYEIRPNIPHDFRMLVLGTSGNCSDFSVRLMICLEALGLKAALISNVSPAFPGHVFVDAYDPKEDKAYLLDANFSVMLIMPKANGKSFISTLLNTSEEGRAILSKNINIITFPVYFRFVDPGESGFQENALNPDRINQLRPNRENLWRQWLANDTDALINWWKKTPSHRPRTLFELMNIGVIKIPSDFCFSGKYAREIKTAAGISDDES